MRGGQGGVPLQSIDYTYNIRGWLKGINDEELSETDGDVFGMSLVYNESTNHLNNTAQYNGNISGMKWSSYDTEGTGVDQRGYAYTYDHADRLEEANHRKNNGSWGGSSGFDVSGTQYDPNGNLKKITRNNESGSTMDNLDYESYQGNRLMSVKDNATDSLGFNDGNTTGDDYAYDVNGNMIKDLNKGIETIHYNHLDLPVKIVLSPSGGGQGEDTPDSLTYTYTASGSKLGMKVWKGGVEEGAVDYVGNIRYEDGVLRSIAHEEGRIVLSDSPLQGGQGGVDYQYHLKDHQGNTRRVLSTLPEVYTSVEDFEDGTSNFSDLRLHTYSEANSTTPLASNDGVSLLQSGENSALVMFRMDKGDTIDLKVQANYESAPSGNTFASTAYNALFTSWDNAYGSGVEGGIGNGSSGAFDDALTNGMGGKDGTSSAPRAFLNYIFFDLDMTFKTAGFKQITTSAHGIGVHEEVAINEIVAGQAGYLLAYLSNENQEAVNIYFDDFEVRHTKTNVVQAIDYYPFGLEAMTYTRTAADPTKYLYNGGVEKNDYTSYYETFYRNYDASIGRFMGVDIAAAKFSSQTPYQYAFNDPVYWNDPLGDAPMGDLYDNEYSSNSRYEAGFYTYVDGSNGRFMGPRGGNDVGGWVENITNKASHVPMVYINREVGYVPADEILAETNPKQLQRWRDKAEEAIAKSKESESKDCPSCETNYPIPSAFEFFGVDQDSWNSLVKSFINSEKSMTEVSPIFRLLIYETTPGTIALGTAYWLRLFEGAYDKDYLNNEYEPNIFLHDQHLVDILKDSTESGASKGVLLKLNRRNSTVIFPKVTPNK